MPVRAATHPGRRSASASRTLVGAVVVAAALHVLTGGHLQFLYVSASVAAAIAATVGLRRWPGPGRSAGWRWLGGGLWLWAAGEVTYMVLGAHGETPFPSVADAFYLAGYGCIAVGVWLLCRGPRSEALWDAAVLTVALVLTVWSAALWRVLDGAGTSALSRAVAAAYPVADVLLCVPFFLLAMTCARVQATNLLAAGFAGLLAADAVYALQIANQSYAVGGLVDVPWMLAYALLGAAFLHPSRDLVGREPELPVPLSATRLLGLLGLVAAVAAFEHAGRYPARLSGVLVVVMLAVVATRLVPLVRALGTAAITDGATGLPNRSHLVVLLRNALAELAVNAGSVCVVWCGVDHLTLVNESFGHRAGDDLLRGLASRLRAAAGGGATVARTSSDELAIVARVPDDADTNGLTARVNASLTEPITVSGTVIYPTLSMGVACATSDRADAELLLRSADSAMNLARARGRARVEHSSPELLHAAKARLQLAAALHDALETAEIHAHFQPEVDLRSGAVVAFEALARWTNPRLGAVPPDQFIPLAEASGMIGSIFERVLDHSLDSHVAWRRSALHIPPVAVNLSPAQLSDRTVPGVILRALERRDLTPRDVWIEVTETALSELADLRYVLDALHDAGVRLAIDDFGTGWSSLERLARLPWDLIKIDRSFVADLGATREAEHVVAATIGLAHGMDILVLAEGIETREQAQLLTELGCDYAQGYLFARPMPAADIHSVITDGIRHDDPGPDA